MAGETRIGELKAFALNSVPPIQNSIRLDAYIAICKNFLQMIGQYKTEKNLISTYIFGIRYISLVSNLSQHNYANDTIYKPQIRMLQTKAQALLFELTTEIRPALVQQLQSESELHTLKNTGIPTDPAVKNSPIKSTIHSNTVPNSTDNSSIPLNKLSTSLSSVPSTSPLSTTNTNSTISSPLSSSSLYPSLNTVNPIQNNSLSTPSAPPVPLYPSLNTFYGPSTSIIPTNNTTLPYPNLNNNNNNSNVQITNSSATSYSDLRKMLAQPAYSMVPSTTNKSHTSFPSASSNSSLRSLRIPTKLLQTFLQLAYLNTSKPPRGIETCGVLCGKVYDNELKITHLILPKQKGEEDNCEMLAEEELFDITTTKGIVTIGWIHTHPSQDCFMSSMDLHTQVSYQLLLPEAIAIVMAPNSQHGNQYAAFRLTEGGLEVIQSCNLRGFHPHDQESLLYENSGHIIWEKPVTNNTNTNNLQLQVIDLR